MRRNFEGRLHAGDRDVAEARAHDASVDVIRAVQRGPAASAVDVDTEAGRRASDRLLELARHRLEIGSGSACIAHGESDAHALADLVGYEQAASRRIDALYGA